MGRRSTWMHALALMLVLAPVAILWAYARFVIVPSTDRCTDVTQPEHRVLAGAPVELALREGEDTSLAFGRDYAVKRLTIRMITKDGAVLRGRPSLDTVVREFRRDDDARLLNSAIRANAHIDRGSIVRLRICVERTGELRADPGRYTGSMILTDPRIVDLEVPIAITLAYPTWPLPAGLLYAVMVFGTVYVFAIQKGLREDNQFLSHNGLAGLFRWVRSWGGVVSVIAGSVAAVSAFTATYLASPDWGSSVSQFLGLTGTMFTAYVAGATAPHVVGGIAARDDTGNAP